MNGTLNYIINLQNGNFGRGISQAEQQVSKLDSMVGKLTAGLGALASINYAQQLIEDTTQIKAKFDGYNNVIQFASANNAEYAKNQEFLNKVIAEMKLPLDQTTDSFAQWLGGIKNTSLEGELGRKVFLGVSAAATTMHLSTEKVSRTYMALSQMMGKGKVQAEELRGQLGEALPGAFQIAAKSMGVTTAQLNDMLEKGKVLPEDLLPKLADELLRTFGPGVQNAAESLQSKINAATNEILRQKIAIGEQLYPVQLAWMNLQLKGLELVNWAISFYKEYKTVIDLVAVGLLSMAAAYTALTLASKIYAIWQSAALVVSELYLAFTMAIAEGTTVWTAAQWALNIALTANPIGVVIMAIAALVGMIVYAYNESENFRATMDGVFAVLKNVAELMLRIAAIPFTIAAGPKAYLENLREIKNLGMGLADTYTDARAESFNKSWNKPVEKAKSPLDQFKEMGTGSKIPGMGASAKSKGGSSESGGAGKSIKSITIVMGKEMVKITQNNINNSMSNAQLQKVITDIIVGAAHDAEVMIANN